ncbi:CRISPR-associated exonuclease, Cas4 family [Bacteroides zoogleoformans]|mgnify:CR=1 FL=1|uniref:CRISPR-associated exonuclease Cas4 n=1 Tax=Bacteroides zoogleoformans TaxID=28119 RepID=A0ABN5IG95_9BACE|nr:CRISPR-associated protein Cas4 [Bacteroides zoogleoformans]AVM51782.1 CRISPR-associated protein Cas4 [Bacteroides zoogleoformans]TWJ08379.1 CRISPR-associated exonuclease, Cas4 family [Bacteroides zoogleoformans]
MYTDDEMLMLSGIQHYRFCPRQWALIHIEQQWEDNRLTTEGHILHRHVDDPFYRQKCGDYICLRSVSVGSHKLGLYGVTDVVELHPADDEHNSILHPNYPGRWTPYPVEYKHGKPKKNQIDEVQLTAQAICLEEAYNIRIREGALFYAETKRREKVIFTQQLRDIVKQCADEMHAIYETTNLPQADYRPCCNNCSLLNICMPMKKKVKNASFYIKRNLYEETT